MSPFYSRYWPDACRQWVGRVPGAQGRSGCAPGEDLPPPAWMVPAALRQAVSLSGQPIQQVEVFLVDRRKVMRNS